MTNLVDAVLRFAVLLVVPAVLALIVLLLLRRANGRNTRGRNGHNEVTVATPATAVAYVILGILAGGALGFIALEAVYGMFLTVTTGVLLFRQARRCRWFAVGGFLLGMGLCTAGFLSAALTNRDPAVTYDPSTIPFFWIATVVALCGVLTLAAATTALRRRGPAQ